MRRTGVVGYLEDWKAVGCRESMQGFQLATDKTFYIAAVVQTASYTDQ